MDETQLKPDEGQAPPTETPEDVAVLYSWANMRGGKYRDFSASRREFRAQQRHRQAEAQQHAELAAARLREEAAAREIEASRSGEQFVEVSADATGHVASEVRQAALRHEETAEEMKRLAEQARVEMEQARHRAEEQAARYAEADKRWRASQEELSEAVRTSPRESVPDARSDSPAQIQTPAQPGGDVLPAGPAVFDSRRRRESVMDLSTRTERRPRLSERFPETGEYRWPEPSERVVHASGNERRSAPRTAGERETVPNRDVSPEWLLGNDPSEDASRQRLQAEAREPAAQKRGRLWSEENGPAPEATLRPEDRYRSDAGGQKQSGSQRADENGLPEEQGMRRVADDQAQQHLLNEDRTVGQNRRRMWDRLREEDDRLASETVRAREMEDVAGPAGAGTLQESRERVAARWFALKGLMAVEAEHPQGAQHRLVSAKELLTPCLSIVSLSGGVGKTSLVATIGRALSSVGEKVLLADTTPYGLLPYYFGARELRPDVVRTFSPPPGSPDAPVYMVNYETNRLNGDEARQAQLVEEMMRHAVGAGRILLDLNSGSAWLARLLTRYHSNILVPIAADMNSVLSIQSVDRFFSGCVDSEGRPVAPYYVLNQFDTSLPLHLDVREVLRQQLGNRLLPLTIRRSPAVSEALAEGMTVIDYAPDSLVTEDYRNLAEWVRGLAAPATTGLRSIRWSER